jgi:hypothetical protein
LEAVARFGGAGVTWRQCHDLEAAVVRLGIKGSYVMQDFFCKEEREGGDD